MPPVSQGSRAGLITAVVIFAILFVTSTIFWTWTHAQWNKSAQDLDNLRTDLKQYVNESQFPSEEYTTLNKERGSRTVLDYVLDQRNQLAKAITGSPKPSPAANEQAASALKAASDEASPAGVKLAPGDSLVNAIRALAGKVADLHTQNAGLTQAVAEAKQETENTIAARNALMAEKDKQIAAAKQEALTANESFAGYQGEKSKQVETIEADTLSKLETAQKENETQQTQLAEREAKIKEMEKDIEILNQRLSGVRYGNVNESTIRQADGSIIRLSDKDTVYINLGMGDQISPGLTFEVYDKESGIPALGDGLSPENLPVGKGSIEVVKVGPGSSECRVVKVEPGQNIVQGDLIANLVYDTKAKYNFLVYGEFDMDQDNKPAPGDDEIIKRLIRDWGGTVTDVVNVNTDFVIMGLEPELPVLTEEDKEDPVMLKKLADAQAALDAYYDVREAAAKLNIPIMNQNRFLYFVGYYDQSSR